MNKTKRHLSEKNLFDILQKNETGLNFTKDRDETTSNYAPHSTTSYGFKKKTRFRYTENDDWDKQKEKRYCSNKPQLTRVVFRSNRPNDPLSNDIYKKHYDPIMTTSKYDIQAARNSNMQFQESPQKERLPNRQEQEQYNSNGRYQNNGNTNGRLSNQTFSKPITPSGFQRKYINKSSSQTPKTFYSTQLPNKYNHTKREHNQDLNAHERQQQEYHQKEVGISDSQKKINTEDLEYGDYGRNPYYDYENDVYDDADEQAVFDQISNQDWYKLLPEEVLNNKNIDIDKFFIDNSEYFYNLLCQNAQMRSSKPFFFNNDNTTAKLKYNPAFNTTYNRNFFRKTQQFQNTPQLTDKMKETNFLGLQQLDYISQKQNDYKDHGSKGVERKVRTYQPAHKPFMGLTSYNSNFINWRDYKQQFEKAPHHISTKSDIPFFGKTSYQEAFSANQNQKGDIAEIDRNKLFKGPIPTYPLFFGETNYASNFRPFIVKKPTIPQANNAAAPQTDRLENEQTLRQSTLSQIPSYQGQFRSMTQKDFGAYKEEKFLTSKLKKVWRQKIQKKLEELRDLKDQRQLQELQ